MCTSIICSQAKSCHYPWEGRELSLLWATWFCYFWECAFAAKSVSVWVQRSGWQGGPTVPVPAHSRAWGHPGWGTAATSPAQSQRCQPWWIARKWHPSCCRHSTWSLRDTCIPVCQQPTHGRPSKGICADQKRFTSNTVVHTLSGKPLLLRLHSRRCWPWVGPVPTCRPRSAPVMHQSQWARCLVSSVDKRVHVLAQQPDQEMNVFISQKDDGVRSSVKAIQGKEKLMSNVAAQKAKKSTTVHGHLPLASSL